MILGYWRNDGIYLPLTRLSNTVAITQPEKLDLADNIFIGHFNFIDASNGLTIQEGCQLTNFISILTHSSHHAIRLYGRHYIAANGKHKGYVRGSVTIGAYSFIGPHSLIMPGTTIGKGSMIAAYSRVNGQFPDFAILAGNPAQIIGDTRNRDAQYLTQFPELQAYYSEWAHALPF